MNNAMWFKFRMVLIALGLFSGLFVPTEQIDELRSMPAWMLGTIAIAIAVITPLIMLFVVGIQAMNPMSDKVWTKPNHNSNPFRRGNPLLFFHFAGYCFLACGIGEIFASLWRGPFFARVGLLIVFYAMGILFGLRLSTIIFKNKFSESTTPMKSSRAEQSNK